MVYASPSAGRSRGHAWHGIVMMLLLTIIGVLSVNLFGRNVSFSLLPLLGVILWPRGSLPVASILAMLIFGLLLDFLTGGPLGLWALVYLILFALLRPHQRLKPHTFKTAFLQVLGGLILALVLAFGLAWFASGHRPDIALMLAPLLAAIGFFPLVYGLRYFFKQILGGADERGI